MKMRILGIVICLMTSSQNIWSSETETAYFKDNTQTLNSRLSRPTVGQAKPETPPLGSAPLGLARGRQGSRELIRTPVERLNKFETRNSKHETINIRRGFGIRILKFELVQSLEFSASSFYSYSLPLKTIEYHYSAEL